MGNRQRFFNLLEGLGWIAQMPPYADNQIPPRMEKSLDATRGLRFIKRAGRLQA